MHDQAEDRCHRIGQRDAVTAWYLLAADTIDETMARLIQRKRAHRRRGHRRARGRRRRAGRRGRPRAARRRAVRAPARRRRLTWAARIRNRGRRHGRVASPPCRHGLTSSPSSCGSRRSAPIPARRRRRERGRVGVRADPRAPAARPSCSTGTGQPLAVGELRASRDADYAPDGPLLRPFRRPAARPAGRCGSRRRSSPRSAASTSTPAASPTTRASSTCCCRAARELAQAGELPVNVRFACDGEEETGGDSILEFLAADERGADAAVIFDSAMIARDRAAFNIATRGLVYFHLTLRTGERDLHSGVFGGAALNAAHALIRTLDAVIAVDGRLVEPLRAGILAPDQRGARGLARAPGRRRRARRPGRPAEGRRAPPRSSTCGRSPSRRSTSTAIESGSPHLQKTVLPVRRAPTCRSAWPRARSRPRSQSAFERLLRDAAPAGAELEVDKFVLRRSRPGRARRGGDPARHQARSSARWAARPALIRSGGTLPIAAGARRARHPHHHHRVLAARRQHPLAQRADAGRLHPARDLGRARRCSRSSPRCSAPFRPARPWVRRPPWHQGGRTEPFVHCWDCSLPRRRCWSRWLKLPPRRPARPRRMRTSG